MRWTRFIVGLIIPLIEKKLIGWGSKLWLFERRHCKEAPRSRRYCERS